MIYIVGDTHGEIDASKLNNSTVKNYCEGVFPDYVIVSGDFGFIWYNNPDNPTEQYWLKWLEKKPWITLFVDGNHENHHRLQKLQEVKMFNSVVGQVSDKIFHLKRGQVYTIEGKTFFTMGGAESIDKERRVIDISWWKEEIPNYAEFYEGVKNLNSHCNEVDYVITHTAPKKVFDAMFPYRLDRFDDPVNHMLESYREKIIAKAWFFGHMHEDKEKVIDNILFKCLYEKPHIIL